MKILMLGWELPPYNSGGLGVACYQLCKALAKRDADIEFVLPYRVTKPLDFMKVTPAYPQNVRSVLQAGTAYDSYKYVFEDGHEEWLDMFGQQRLFERAVAQLVEEREFDIIHAHDWLTFRAGLQAKFRTGCPLIAHVHSVESDRAAGAPGNPLVREIESLGLTMADQVIAVSQHTKDAIVRDYGIPADKIEVVHNSIDREELQPLEPDNAYQYVAAMCALGYRVVTSVGRLTIQKGLPNLLHAAKEVVQRFPKTLFIIVGSGEQYYELIELAAELGIAKNVIFTGFQRGRRWRDSFAIADLFVMPSVSEPFGLTPLEAINYGAPSLISYQSGVSEVLNNCLKVDYWDVQEMANKIAGVLQNQGLHDELRDNAARELERLSWDHSVDKLFGVYEKHLEGAAA